MLNLKSIVPDNLLLDRPSNDLANLLQGENAHWFHICPEALGFKNSNDKQIKWLQSLTSDLRAIPATPNTENSTYADDGEASGLIFKQGLNCGFMLALPDQLGQAYSFAIRYRTPRNNPRTLLTLNPADLDNYLFLQHTTEGILLKDQKTTVEIEDNVNLSATDTCLLVAGYSNGSLSLRVNQERPKVVTQNADLAIHGTSSLFIGCRSNRGGLFKTLGSFTLKDAIFWSDKNVLSAENSNTLNALDTFCMWEI